MHASFHASSYRCSELLCIELCLIPPPPTNLFISLSFISILLSFPAFLLDLLFTLLLKLCPFVVIVKCDICFSFFQFFNILSMSCWLALPRTATCPTIPLASRCARLHRETAVFLVSLTSLSGWLSVCPTLTLAFVTLLVLFCTMPVWSMESLPWNNMLT